MAAKLDKDSKSSPKKPAKDNSSAPKASSKSKQPLDDEELDDPQMVGRNRKGVKPIKVRRK